MPDFDFSSKSDAPEKAGDVIIEDYVWNGASVFICPGIDIGDNSLIEANSVVTKDILPFGIYGGMPARLIRMKKMHA